MVKRKGIKGQNTIYEHY